MYGSSSSLACYPLSPPLTCFRQPQPPATSGSLWVPLKTLSSDLRGGHSSSHGPGFSAARIKRSSQGVTCGGHKASLGPGKSSKVTPALGALFWPIDGLLLDLPDHSSLDLAGISISWPSQMPFCVQWFTHNFCRLRSPVYLADALWGRVFLNDPRPTFWWWTWIHPSPWDLGIFTVLLKGAALLSKAALLCLHEQLQIASVSLVFSGMEQTSVPSV